MNYFITLVTGIFDSLANLSVVYYDLKIKRVDFDNEKGMNKMGKTKLKPAVRRSGATSG